MEPKIISELDLKEKPIKIESTDNILYYLKLIGVGPKTIQETQNMVYSLLEKVNGVFIISSKDNMRKTLHNIVDMAYDDFERKLNNG